MSPGPSDLKAMSHNPDVRKSTYDLVQAVRKMKAEFDVTRSSEQFIATVRGCIRELDALDAEDAKIRREVGKAEKGSSNSAELAKHIAEIDRP
jgi:hypothetical protein